MEQQKGGFEKKAGKYFCKIYKKFTKFGFFEKFRKSEGASAQAGLPRRAPGKPLEAGQRFLSARAKFGGSGLENGRKMAG